MILEMQDILWLVFAAALVFLMQPGFLCLESGLTRSKNSINVAIKNLTDFGISVVVFWAFGFGLVFGISYSGLIGTTDFLVPFDKENFSLVAFFLFQAMFCGTATTIVSGAVAERMRFAGYLSVSFLLSGFIYTFFGHWAWGGVFNKQTPGWLEQQGFVDFAGATVVHGVGGWVALAAVLLIGPRHGRFTDGGSARRFTGQSVPIATLGVLLLWIGWFGFNGGSTFKLNTDVPLIIANTVLSGAAGLVTALFVGWSIRGRPDIDLVMNGSLAGLVAITANCHAVSSIAAVAIGAVGACVMLAMSWLLERLRIDDVVGAIPVHAGAGVWGTIAVALFGDLSVLDTGHTRLAQLGIQVVGVLACFVWSFGSAYILLWLLNRFFALRVTEEEEHRGLNIVEHGATTEVTDLLMILGTQAKTGDLSRRVPADPFTEVGQIAEMYNQVLDALEQAATESKQYAAELERSNRDLNDFASIASHDLHAPLRRVRSLCELLQKYKGKLDADADEFIDFIVSETNSMEALISDLLSYSRVDSHGQAFEKTDCAIVLKKTLALLDVTIQETGATITSDAVAIVNADHIQLGRVFQNLLSNAMKYCEEKPQIHVSVESKDGNYLFKVSDNGIGIPPEDASDVFVMLKRLHSNSEYAGTGIGLSICKRIVERHGGRIWVEPAVDQGSVFCFTLPIVE